MRHILAGILGLAVVATVPQVRATSIGLQDIAINVNGSTADYNNPSDPDPTALPGINFSAFNLSTGLGTIGYVMTGAPGTYYVNFYLDMEAGVPFFNEYGAINGSAPAGTSYEIAQVNPSVGGIQFYNGSTESFVNTLDHTNHVPIGSTNYLNNCTVAPCNADVALALGFSFTLAASQEAVITFNTSTTNPGGFSIEDIHPVDPNNAVASAIYESGMVSVQPINAGPSPEPNFLPLLSVLGAVAATVAFRRNRWIARQKRNQ